MQLDAASVCGRCRPTRDHQRESPDPYLMGADNNMDPGPLPSLPILSPIEEMLIARVHLSMEMYTILGQAHDYKGHVCSFLWETARIYRQLPLLPREIGVVLMQPTGNIAVKLSEPHMGSWTAVRPLPHCLPDAA